MAAEAGIGAGTCTSGGQAAALLSDGIAVLDGFAAPERVLELIECGQVRFARGEFAAARIGAQGRSRRREEIRGDHTCWLAEPLLPAERALLGELEQLRLQLNYAGFFGLFDLELHYARYPPGAGYARHVDQPQGRDQRKISFILYLNPGWHPPDGGELRLFESSDRYRDIEPIGGRLVCFLTAGTEHAVLPTQSARSSICGWFRGRE